MRKLKAKYLLRLITEKGVIEMTYCINKNAIDNFSKYAPLRNGLTGKPYIIGTTYLENLSEVELKALKNKY